MYHVKSASMKVSQMKASRSFRWKFSASQLIITRNVRALFFFLSLYISSFFECPDWQSGLSPTHFTKFTSRTEALRERWWGQETRQVVLRDIPGRLAHSDDHRDRLNNRQLKKLQERTFDYFYHREMIRIWGNIYVQSNFKHYVMHTYIKNITWDMSLICTTLRSHISILK